jgi:hypothetical protein
VGGGVVPVRVGADGEFDEGAVGDDVAAQKEHGRILGRAGLLRHRAHEEAVVLVPRVINLQITRG